MAKRKATYTYLGEEFVLTENKWSGAEIGVTDANETAFSYVFAVVQGFEVIEEKYRDNQVHPVFDNLTDALDCACANVICVRNGVIQLEALFDNTN